MTKTEQLMRRTGITAAEAVGLAGLSELTPLEIYRRKMKPRRPPSPQRSEWPIVRLYGQKDGYVVDRNTLMSRNPAMRFAICEPRWSRFELAHTCLVLPVRLYSARLPRTWGAAGSSLVPAAIYAEAQWMLGATGLSYLDVAVLYAPPVNKLQVRRLRFDQAEFYRLYAISEHFMVLSVLAKNPPVAP